MEQIERLLSSIKYMLMFITWASFFFAMFYLSDITKAFFLDIAPFDKYIDFQSIEIYNARKDWNYLVYDWTTTRNVRLNPSYELKVIGEFECDSGDWYSLRGNISDTRIMDSKSNPWVRTIDTKRQWLRIRRWDKCFIRYWFILNNGYEDKYETLETNVFTVE